MFTIRHIRTMLTTSLGLTKGGVKWESSKETQTAIDNLERDASVADLLKRAELSLAKVHSLQAKPNSDPIIINNAIEYTGDILKKIDGKNIKDRQAVLALLDTAISSAPQNSDSKKGLEALKTQLEGEYEKIDEKNSSDRDQTKTDIKKETSRAFESVVQKNSREQQAKDFTEYVAGKLSDPLKQSFLDAFTKESNDTINTNPKYELESVSIPNLLQSIEEGTVYIADGAEFNDRPAVKKFLEFYNTNKSVLGPILKPLVTAARAGQSAESVRKSGDLPKADATNTNIIKYLAKVDNFETHGTTALDRQLSAATVILLEKVKGDDKKFFQVLSNAAKLGGVSTGVTKENLSTDASLKYAILAGIREASRLPGGINALIDAKGVSGIGENERKMLTTLDKDKTKLLDGLKDGFQKQLEKQIKDGTIPANKQVDAQNAIDAYIAEMKKEGSPGWNIVSKNIGAAITNRGAGAGAAATMDFPPNWLADNVSLGFAFSTGKPGFGVGITFDKSVTPDTKILYGWAGTPFVGVSSRFDRWVFTGIAGVGGGMVNVSRDMGNKDLEVKNMEKMKSAEGILSQINALAQDINKKATNIAFSSDYSKYPEKSDDPMEPTKARVESLDKAINADIQNRLSLAGFDEEENVNPVIRAQMIHNALSQAVQSRIDRLHLDDATGGWSLKSLGLSLGSFAGVPFILPSISFGRTSYTQSLKLTRTGENEMTERKAAVAPQGAIAPKDSQFETLDKVASLKSALANKNTRIALSHLWNNPSRKNQVNDFIQKLQSFQVGGATIEDGKNSFAGLTKGLPALRSLSESVSKLQGKELQSALFDIRGAMMMDERQANGVSINKDIVNVNESPDDTKKRFESMVKSEKMRGLLEKMGLTPSDFSDIVKGSGAKNSPISIGESKSNMIGAVASLKSATPMMSIMPAGTMRFAQNSGGEFVKDASSFAQDKKEKMYDTALPAGSVSEIALRTNIAKMLKPNEDKPTPIVSAALKQLMIEGKATIGGREVKMDGQKFLLCAYGDCTNPGIAIQPGKISAPAVPGSPAVDGNASAEYNIQTSSRSETLGLTGAIGWVGKKPETTKGNDGPTSSTEGKDKTPGSPASQPVSATPDN